MQVQVSLLAQWSRTRLPIQEIQVPSLCLEDPLEEEERATRASVLAWEVLWTEGPGGLQRAGHERDWAHLHTCRDTAVEHG